MSKIVTLRLSPRQAADEAVWGAVARRMAGVAAGVAMPVRVLKRSIDARGGSVKVILSVEVFSDEAVAARPKGSGTPDVHARAEFDYPSVTGKPEVIIVGSGPAGMFCALRLIELGLRPIVLERGKPVSERKKDIALINRGGAVDPDSNYAFGEGGAGTFSDGKLFTRSKKRGDYDGALRRLVFHGAEENILWEAHPHIGTDRLPRIMVSMREAIVAAGGEVIFGARVSDIVVKEGRVEGVVFRHETVSAKAVVLATGHSARDVYEMLHAKGVALEAKPFAMGVRIEHPQELIDRIQYHGAARGEWLPAAEYRLVEQVGGRGVWSFCMCPGGFVVPAMTSGDECVVNGMSASRRDSPWANSAIVTEVREADFAALKKEFGPLAGLEFQRRFEVAARAAGAGGQVAPAQRATDFLARRVSTTLPATSYVPGVVPTDFNKWMPRFIAEALRGGLRAFDHKMRGFLTEQALLIGVESRTSTPVRIPRDPETLEHTTLKGLYPAGEGAGYAGGIISAALDGTRVAERVLAQGAKPLSN